MTTTYKNNKKKSASSTVTFDSTGIVAGDTIKISGSSYSTTDGTYIVSNTAAHSITLGDLQPVITEERFCDLEDSVEAIKRRLLILDEPSAEKLEKHKMLEEAYLKYKMIEALIGEKREAEG